MLPRWTRLLLLALLLPVTALHAQRQLPRDGTVMIDERFDVDRGDQLSVAVSDADVVVETGASQTARIVISVRGRNGDRAREYFERQRFRVERSGRTISITTDPVRRTFNWSTGDVQILVRATIPRQFDVNLKTSDGDLFLASLEGRATLRTSDGDVHLEALRGPSLSMRTSDGDIQAEELESDAVDVQTSDGDIRLNTVTTGNLNLRTSDGDIHAERLEGEDVNIQTSDGDIVLGQLGGLQVLVRTSDGDIRLDALTADRAEVRTSDGNLTLTRVDGRLEAQTSGGSIQVALFKPSDVSLRTSDGDITITTPRRLPADLRLDGDRVRIASGFAFQGELEKERARGRINGGGPLVDARASDGTVSLEDQ